MKNVIFRTIWEFWSKAKTEKGDVHTRIMKKNYAAVPDWWFYVILAVVFALALLACEGFGKQLQLPWWGLLSACSIAFFFTLPIGVIQATTNQVTIESYQNVWTCLVCSTKYDSSVKDFNLLFSIHTMSNPTDQACHESTVKFSILVIPFV